MPRNVDHCNSPVAIKPVKVDNLSRGTSAIDTMNTKILMMQSAATRDSCYDAQKYDEPPAERIQPYKEAFTYGPYAASTPLGQQTRIFLIVIAAGLAGVTIMKLIK
jgi:hypothetical protein